MSFYTVLHGKCILVSGSLEELQKEESVVYSIFDVESLHKMWTRNMR